MKSLVPITNIEHTLTLSQININPHIKGLFTSSYYPIQHVHLSVKVYKVCQMAKKKKTQQTLKRQSDHHKDSDMT